MKKQPFSRQPGHSLIFVIASFLLAGLMASSLAFGDEIHDAAGRGDVQKVTALLKESPDLVSSKDPHGATPLHWAASNGSKDVAELLVAKGADVNARTDNGMTALHIAAARGHNNLVEFLLANGAGINVKMDAGQTPLTLAVWQGHKDVVEFLLAHGAEVNVHDAAAIGDLGRVTALLKGHPALLLDKDKDGTTPLHDAAGHGHKDVVEFLITHGADVNVKMNDGKTPLYLAAMWGHKDVVELLLAHRANVNLVDNDGNTPLYIARKSGHDDLAELLRQHGGQYLFIPMPATNKGTAAGNAPARQLVDKKTIESMMRGHILASFGDKNVGQQGLGIAAVNGTPFDKLPHSLALGPGGAVEYWGGRPIPEKGSPIRITFDTSTIVVSAIADGEGGIYTIQKMEIADSTHIQLKAGGSYILRDGRWVKE